MALDQSDKAINATRKSISERGITNLHCVVGDVTGPYLGKAISGLGSRTACIYARFFLHAITEKEQNVFFQTLSEKLQPGNRLVLEYRTTADQFLEKHAQPHYRRYQPAEHVNTALKGLGFQLLYENEGQGYAKYKDEDAIVARSIFKKV